MGGAATPGGQPAHKGAWARGLRFRFVLVVASIAIVMGLVQSTTLLVGFQQSSEEQLRRRAAALSRDLAAAVSALGPAAHRSALARAIERYAGQPDVAYVAVLGPSGTVLAHSDPDLAGQTLDDPLTTHALKAETAGLLRYTTDADTFFDAYAPVVRAEATDAPAGAPAPRDGVARVGVSLRETHRVLWRYVAVTLTLLVALTAAATLVALFFVRLITAPLARMTDAATRMAGGDFSGSLELTAEGEVGVLAGAFGRMSASLAGIIGQIRDASVEITSEGGRMLADARRLGDGATRQAEAAERTSAAVAEMSGSVRHIAENVESVSASAEATSASVSEMTAAIGQVAESAVVMSSSVDQTAAAITEMSRSIRELVAQVDSLFAGAREATTAITEMAASARTAGDDAKGSAALTEQVSRAASEQGLTAVERTIEGMARIRQAVQASHEVVHRLGERTEHVGKILTVIDDVTDQTSLLALNAAILAAQAGEQGRGFAVVADEIKSLAERTAASTREIADLIRDVQSETRAAVESIGEGTRSVDEGVALSARAREALAAIVESANRSSAMSRRIEAASAAQMEGTGRVTTLVQNVHGLVERVRSVMLEHERGIVEIARASEGLRAVAEQVRTATEEQAGGSRQINEAMENVTARLEQIVAAVNEQERVYGSITASMSEVRDVSRASATAVAQINRSVEGLTRQAEHLQAGVERFAL